MHKEGVTLNISGCPTCCRSKERRRGLEMGAALSQLWGLVGQLRSQSAAPTAAPQQPLRPPAASGRRGTGSDGDEDTQV